MPKRKKIFLLIAIVLQIVALGAICFQREAVLHGGDTVFMRTRPVDPRDLFRGDYVRLTYEVSQLPMSLIVQKDVEQMRKPERRVHLSYKTDARNMMIPLKLELAKPKEGKFIRGFTTRNWRKDMVTVRYGLEKFFIQQRKGLGLERGKLLEGIQIPLEMEVAVGKDSGITVLKGYRYAEMGMGILLPSAISPSQSPSFKVIVKLVNASPSPLSIVDPEDHGTFKIELSPPERTGNVEKIRFKHPFDDPETYQQSDLKVIAPYSVYQFELDLSLPRYQLVRGEKEVWWSEMKYWESARIIYQAPELTKFKALPDIVTLWRGRLVSRSFSGRNFRD